MANAFKPQGIPARDLRLSDLDKLDQEAAAARMNISRQTFGRVLAEARELVAEALVMGKMIRIQGGSFSLPGAGEWGRGGRGRRGRHGRNVS